MSAAEVLVRVADLRAAAGDSVLVTVGLGSCVAIALYDAEAKVGGLAHVLLPSRALSRGQDSPGKFPETAVPRLLELMSELGAARGRITARLAGGASMFGNIAPSGSIQMGERNVVACRQALVQLEIPLVGEAVGGDYGRTVRLAVGSGRFEVSSVRHGPEDV